MLLNAEPLERLTPADPSAPPQHGEQAKGNTPLPMHRQTTPASGISGLTPISPCGYARWKDHFELVIAFLLFVLALPVIVLCALLVRLTSSGPAFYSQVRVGKNGRPFRILKIRTMRTNAEQQCGATWSLPGDPRVTLIGRILRRSHLDELPQLWNVLCGDMGLIGPRPERPEFVPSLEKAIPCYRDRLLVRPGVSGLAQVQLPADTDLESVRRKLAYDLHYIRSFGLWLDIRLMVSTGLHMFGVPYGILCKLLAIPREEVVQAGYREQLQQLKNGA